MAFDQLGDVRTLARARAVEDFAYFTGAVLGMRLSQEECDAVQRGVQEHGVFTVLPERQKREGRAVQLWLVVLGLRQERVLAPTETFSWLFPEHCEHRKSAEERSHERRSVAA